LTDSTSDSVAVPRPSKLMKKAALYAAFFFAQGALAACPPPESLSSPIAVSRVTDGDTLRLNTGQRVRLVGLNALEMNSKGWQGRQARRARETAVAFLPEKVQVTPWPAPTDRYGRLLANIWHDKQYLAEHLVLNGMAFAVAVPPNIRLADCLKDAETRARSNRVGLWTENVFPQAIRDLGADLGGFQILHGTVTSTASAQRSNVAVIDGLLRLELRSGLAALTPGDRIEVRGWVTRSPKPIRQQMPWTLKVSHPANLDILP